VELHSESGKSVNRYRLRSMPAVINLFLSFQNLNNSEIVTSWSQAHCYPSEAYFIPRPARGPDDVVDEDDGVLISIVLDAQRAASFLLVLDSNTLQPICRADLPELVPLSFARYYSRTFK
jgi:carotenoid cleavage dioxygenase-like enzyme